MNAAPDCKRDASSENPLDTAVQKGRAAVARMRETIARRVEHGEDVRAYERLRCALEEALSEAEAILAAR